MPFAARKTKKKNGFTLSEVLVVVALIAVLLAFAVPAILGYVRRLKLRALDTDAETIFWAAQHRLTAMAASGELDMLHTKPDADGNDPYRLYINADGVVSTASLADGAVYAWLGSDAPADAVQLDLADILPFGAIESELRAGHFAIEFSKETGAVYAVWYTDEDGFDYAAGINGRPDSEDLETRLQKSPLVGFFGGGIIERPEIGQLPIPRVSVTNTNLLYIDIALPGTDAAITPNISVTLTGADSHAELTLPLEGAATVRGLDAGKIGRVVLDMLPGGDPLTGTAAPNLPAWTVLAGGSMYNGTAKDTTGCQFKDWAAGSDLRPGEDITVTVTVSLDGYLPQRMRVQTNSLFANLFTDTDANGDGLGDSTGLDIAVAPIAIAQIAYGRHLQNLDPGISGVPDVQTSTWKETDPSGREETKYSSAFLPGAVRAAQQVRDIDFSMPDTLPDGWQDAYWALVYKDYTGVNPLNPTFTQGKAFTPITNAALACFDGNEEFIRNLRVDAPGSGFGAGLFDTVGNSFDNACEIYLKNIVLVNATVDVPYAFAVGSLAGSTTSKAHIDNCQVYLDSVGDIPKDNGVPIPWVSCETAMANVGGMVGALYADAELTNSFAATVTNGAQAGGMVGMSVNATFDRCYASGYIIAAQLGGGLLASSGNMQIT